jgi:adenylate kinase
MENLKSFKEHTGKTPCLVLAGPPGSGKGTQSKNIKEATGFVHISTGDIIRNSGDKRLMAAAASGSFISDEDSLELIKKFLVKNKGAKGFIWDGYPRTSNQAIAFKKLIDEMEMELSGVILLKPDQEVLIKRLLDRAKKENREDDEEDKIRKRMSDYKDKTQFAIDKLSSYVSKDQWLTIKGDLGIEKTWENIKKFLAEINLLEDNIKNKNKQNERK